MSPNQLSDDTVSSNLEGVYRHFSMNQSFESDLQISHLRRRERHVLRRSDATGLRPVRRTSAADEVRPSGLEPGPPVCPAGERPLLRSADDHRIATSTRAGSNAPARGSRPSHADGLFATPSSNLFYPTGIDFHRSERLTALFVFQGSRSAGRLPRVRGGSPARDVGGLGDPHVGGDGRSFRALAASLFPAGAGTLAVEPSTAFDDVERLIAAAARDGGRSRPPPSSALADGQDAPRRSRRSGGRSPWPSPASQKRLRVPARPEASRRTSPTRFGGENVVQFGPSSALPTAPRRSRPLAQGRRRADRRVGPPEGYFYDITRSTFFGDPTDEYRRIWSVVLEAQTRRDREGGSRRPLLRGGRRRAPRHREGRDTASTSRTGSGMASASTCTSLRTWSGTTGRSSSPG